MLYTALSSVEETQRVSLFIQRESSSLISHIHTGAALGWAIADQCIVHLSLNHATLPRIHVFLRNLQTGLLVTRITTGNVNSHSKSSKPKSGEENDDSIPLSTTSHGSHQKGKHGFKNPFRSKGSRHSVSLCRDAHSSKTELRLQPDQGNELSTFVSTGADNDSTSSGQDGRGRRKSKGRQDGAWGLYSHGDEIFEGENGPQHPRIKVQKTLEIKTEVARY